jgi:hypothetical protein
MTDLEKFIDTYKQFGIEIKTFEKTQGFVEILLNGGGDTATKSEKFDGYTCYFSSIIFTKEGKFVCQGFWEK